MHFTFAKQKLVGKAGEKKGVKKFFGMTCAEINLPLFSILE